MSQSQMKYQRHLQLPTKSIPSPKRLLETMTKTAGEGNFHVEASPLNFVVQQVV
jgi:hypothetical protein